MHEIEVTRTITRPALSRRERISTSTLKRMEKAGKLTPLPNFLRPVRYSLAQVNLLFPEVPA